MTDTHETIADIIAAKRRLVAEMGKALGDQHASVEMLKDDADRIEAAHKRELSKNTSKNGADFGQLGDAAKLREALVQVQKKINYLIGNLTVPNSLVANRMEFNGIINAALAELPRNCDVHTADELKAIFKSELVSELPIANEHEKNLVTITANGVIDTLFAPAAEKEGGNDDK